MLVALALTVALAADPVPSIDRAARVFGPAVVTVHASTSSRPGFFVAGAGVAVAVIGGDDSDVVVELPSGERRKARVLVKDDDGLALVEVVKLPKDALFPSLGLGHGVPPSSLAWLLGVGIVEGRAAPSVGGARGIDERGRWLLDLPLDPGAPILVDDRVVGVVIERRGKTACTAVPVERVLALVKRIP